MFRGIAAEGFPPFGKFTQEFPPVPDRPPDLGEVHVFAGINGTGKSRLLAALAAFLGNHSELVRRLGRHGDQINLFASESERPKNPRAERHNCGLIVSGPKATPRVARNPSLPWFPWLTTIPAFAYSGSAYLSDAPPAGIAKTALRLERAAHLDIRRSSDHSKPLIDALVQIRIQAAMEVLNDSPQPSATQPAQRLLGDIEATLTSVTGKAFKFLVDTYPGLQLSVAWDTLRMSFDSLPDGLRSIVGWLVHAAVMIDMASDGKSSPSTTKAVFLLDEPETHLHPAWQRRILPAFQRLFSNAQIFVATHSPFVISSLNHGWIHRFRHEGTSRVVLDEPKLASPGDSYLSVLEDLMEVREWYDPETEKLLARFRELRNAAFAGNTDARGEAEELGIRIASRSYELEILMGKELRQLRSSSIKEA